MPPAPLESPPLESMWPEKMASRSIIVWFPQSIAHLPVLTEISPGKLSSPSLFPRSATSEQESSAATPFVQPVHNYPLGMAGFRRSVG
jgi:hypothetical protein